MKEMLRLVAILTLICAFCAALLATVFNKTEGPIAAAKRAKRLNAARAVLPTNAPAPQTVEAPAGVTNFASFADGALVATAVEGRSTHGYGGDMVVMAGLAADGRLLDYRLLEQHETPGLGTKVEGDAFKSPLLGRPIAGNWTVRKDGGEVDAVTGATISSRALLEALRDAFTRHQAIAASLATKLPAVPGVSR